MSVTDLNFVLFSPYDKEINEYINLLLNKMYLFLCLGCFESDPQDPFYKLLYEYSKAWLLQAQRLMTHQSLRFTHVVLQDIKKTDLPTEELNICSKKILSRGYGNLTYQVEGKLTNLRSWASRGIRDPRLMIMIDEFFKEERDFRQKFGKYAFGDA